MISVSMEEIIQKVFHPEERMGRSYRPRRNLPSFYVNFQLRVDLQLNFGHANMVGTLNRKLCVGYVPVS